MEEYVGPAAETMGIVAHYNPNGQPQCREFATVKEARVSYERMVEFGSRLKAKNIDQHHESQVMMLYTRRTSWRRRRRKHYWVLEKSSGSETAASIRLGRWLGLRTNPFEGVLRLGLAYVLGSGVRGFLYLMALRHAPTLDHPFGARSWPKGLVRLANLLVRFCWPYLRVAVNDFVQGFVPPVVNAAIAKMSSRPMEKILRLSLDVGEYPPEITSIACSPSYFAGDIVDMDIGLVMPGDGVRFTIDVKSGDCVVRGEVRRCEVQGALRVKLGPLITPIPCTRTLHFGFAAKPVLKPSTNFRILDDDENQVADDFLSSFQQPKKKQLPVTLDAVERFVLRLVENVVESTLCWPRAVAIPVAAAVLGPAFAEDDSDDSEDDEDEDDMVVPGDEERRRRTRASFARAAAASRADDRLVRKSSRHIRREDNILGTLRVEVQRCTNLTIYSDNPDKANPYVVCKVGQLEERTTTQTTTVDPVWRSPRTFVFDIHEASQQCTLCVYNSDMTISGAFNDPLLGRAHFCLQDLDRGEQPGSPRGGRTTSSRSPPTELRLALDTSVNDSHKGFVPYGDYPGPQNPNAAIYILAKFSKARGLENLAKGRPTGVVPLALAAVYVVSLALLIDLIARPVLALLADVVAYGVIAATVASMILLAWIIITGLLTLNMHKESSS